MYPKISPDGTRAAFTVSPDSITGDIWIWDFLRKTLTRLTFQNAGIQIWTPDSKKIIFRATRDGQQGIYWKNADGTGKEEKLYSEPGKSVFPYSISSDGKNLVVSIVEGEATIQNNKWDIGILSMEGEHVLKPLLYEDPIEVQAEVSPDNRWIAYASTESTGETLKTEIYIRPFPEVDKGKWQVSTSGGSCPRWSPDGRELLYLSDDNAMMAVAVQATPAFSLGTPQKLFDSRYTGKGATEGIPWDIHPKDRRFLMMKEPGTADAASQAGDQRKINVVLNWFEELKARVPAK